MNVDQKINNPTPFTPEQFAHLGGGSIAYVRQMSSDDLQRVFPNIPPMQPGLQLFALLNADGSPIMLTDSRDAALANARENELQPVSVH